MAKTFEELMAEEQQTFEKEQNAPRTTPDPVATPTFPRVAELAKQRAAEQGTTFEQFKGVSDFNFDPISSRVENPQLKEMASGVENLVNVPAKGIGALLTGAQAIESGVTSSLLAGMEGKPEKMGSEFLKGVTGQQITRVSDLFRASGAGDIVAEVGGIATTIATGNLASGDLLTKGLRTMKSAMKKQAFKSKKEKMFGFKDKAQSFIHGFDDAYSSMRSEFNSVRALVRILLLLLNPFASAASTTSKFSMLVPSCNWETIACEP